MNIYGFCAIKLYEVYEEGSKFKSKKLYTKSKISESHVVYTGVIYYIYYIYYTNTLYILYTLTFITLYVYTRGL